MSHRIFSFICAAGLVSASALAGDTRHCGGGEGPKPLSDITATFPSVVHSVPTEGRPEEFLVWEQKKNIVYRNSDTSLFATTISGEKNFLSTSSKPISSIIDDEERFVITAHDTWFLDTWKGQDWIHYEAPFDSPEHLFWHGRRLFSLASVFNNEGEQTLKLYRYRAGDFAARRICPLLKFNAGEGYHIGEGHSYPWVVLYKTKKTGAGTELTLDRLNVITCLIQPKTYADLIDGEVQSVHYFADISSVAVKIDHEKKNLLWDTGPDAEHCQFFNIGRKTELIPLNHRAPLVATFDQDHGLRVLRLGKTLHDDSKAATILKDMPIADVKARDMWLTSDAKSLFVAPKLIDHSRYLVRLEIPESLGN